MCIITVMCSMTVLGIEGLSKLPERNIKDQALASDGPKETLKNSSEQLIK